MQTTELICPQCAGRYYSGQPLCPVCTDAAHRTYVAALERVAAAAREEHDGRWEPECRICAALAALDALEGGRTDG